MTQRTLLPILLSFLLVGLFFLFAFNYPLSTFFIPHLFPYDQKRLLEIILLAGAVFISYGFFSYSQKILDLINSMQRSTQIALLIFLTFGFFSAVFSAVPSAGFLEYSLFVLLIFFAIFWAALGITIGENFFFYNALLIYFSIFAFLLVFIKAYFYSISHNSSLNFFPFFINIRFFAQYSIWTLPLLPLVDYWIRDKKSLFFLRIVFFILASLWWSFSILNGSRGLLISVGVASLLGLFLFRRNFLPWVIRQFFYVAAALTFIFLFTHSLQKNVSNEPTLNIIQNTSNAQTLHTIQSNLAHMNAIEKNTLSPREFLYQSAFHFGIRHPIFGIGPMHYALMPSPEMQKLGFFNAHPHNVILTFFSEWGIPTTVALLCLAFILIRNFLILIRQEKTNFNLACFSVALFSGLLYSLVSGVFVMPLSQIIAVLVIGNCIALYYQPKNFALISSIKKTPQYIFIGALLAFSLWALAFNVLPALSRLPQRETLWYQIHQNDIGVFVPRFWLQGWLRDFPPIKKPLK